MKYVRTGFKLGTRCYCCYNYTLKDFQTALCCYMSNLEGCDSLCAEIRKKRHRSSDLFTSALSCFTPPLHLSSVSSIFHICAFIRFDENVSRYQMSPFTVSLLSQAISFPCHSTSDTSSAFAPPSPSPVFDLFRVVLLCKQIKRKNRLKSNDLE